MKAWLVVVMALVCGFYLFSCTHKPFGQETVTPVDTTGGTDTSICFKRDVLPIFINNCAVTGCHDAASNKEGYTLTDYARIVSKGIVPGNSGNSKIYKECAEGKMPQSPYALLSATKLSYLRRWIDMGAPNDTNCAVTCDTTKFAYSDAVNPILAGNCRGCHGSAVAATAGAGIDLGTYDAVKVYALNGRLLGSVQHATGYSSMPKGSAKLSDCKITQIRRWIAAGAPNN